MSHQADTKTTREMCGEAFREMAILVVVFGFLDAVFGERRIFTEDPWMWSACVLTSSAALFFFGVLFERYK
jgi:hypothetical protein